MKIFTLCNALNKILYDKETEIKLQGLENKDYADAFAATNTEDIREWLGTDKDDVGYHNLTHEEIIYQIQGQNEEVGSDSDDNHVPQPTISKVWGNLDELINFIDNSKNVQIYYVIIKEKHQEFI